MDKLKWQNYVFGCTGGFLIGFVILHPFSMFFQGLIHPSFKIDFSAFTDAFNPHHLPMAFFFGILGLLVAIFIVFLLTSLSEEKEKVEILEGLLPICSYCKKIRDDDGKEKGTGDWIQIERYIKQRSDADFTHGVCPECYEKMMEEISKD